MQWLGITWDGLPVRQSERLGLYETHLAQMHDQGLIYRCFLTRKDIDEAVRAPHGAPGGVFHSVPLSTLEERDNLAAGRPYAWRLSLNAARAHLGTAFQTLSFIEETDRGLVEMPADPSRLGDVVLGRKDSGTSYHLSSVIDDAAQGVTHVTRGEDLREAAGLHALLYRLLDLTPPIYRHHKLITDDNGRRLAKRDKSATLHNMREAGVTAEEIRVRLLPDKKT